MRKRKTKSAVYHKRSAEGAQSASLSLSIYPEHLRILRARERELNVHRSVLLQLLLEIDERDGLLRREVQQRIERNHSANIIPPQDHYVHD